MATTTTTTTTTKPNKKDIPSKANLSPEQDTGKKQEAYNLLKHLQKLLMEGETPALDILSEALLKFEELSAQTSRQGKMDPETRKTLEDISALLLSARQLARNKGIAERLQKITEESQIAMRDHAPNKQEVAASSKEISQDLTNFINAWRPLFYLLLTSREFRVLILDSIRIIKRVIYSYTDDVKGETRKKFIKGETAKHIATNIKDQFKEKGTPELSDKEWETIQDDLQRVLLILAGEPKYHDGVEQIFTLLDMFQNSLLNIPAETGLPEVKIKDPHLQKIVGETEALVSSFSGKDTLEEFKYYLRRLIQKSREHEDLHTYLHEVKEYILLTKSEEVVRSYEFREKSKQMAHRGRKLFRQFREDDDLEPFLRTSKRLINNIKNDEMLQLLRYHAGIVQSDLSYVDNEGKLQVDTDMLASLQKVLLPVLADALKYIPVPKISSSDSNQEFSLDKIVLCSYDIIPENIRFHLETSSEFSLQDIEVKGTHTFLVIQLNQMLTELKDVEFYFKKKKISRN